MADLWESETAFNEAGADPVMVAKLERQLGVQFPEDYKSFMLKHNGHTEVKKVNDRIMPLTEQSMLLNGYLAKQKWSEVLLASGPFPNSECINMADAPPGVWESLLESEMKLLPVIAYQGEAGTMFYRALDCVNGTVLNILVNATLKTVRITPVAMDFRSWRSMTGSDCAQM